MRRLIVIQHHVGHSGMAAMAGDDHCWQRQGFFQRSVNHNKAFNRALSQQVRIFIQQLWLAAMRSHEEKVTFAK